MIGKIEDIILSMITLKRLYQAEIERLESKLHASEKKYEEKALENVTSIHTFELERFLAFGNTVFNLSIEIN